MSNDIDQLFKNSLKDGETSPPEYVWENISKQLNHRKKIVGIWRLRAAAAILFLGLGLGGWLLKKTSGDLVQHLSLTEVQVPTNFIPTPTLVQQKKDKVESDTIPTKTTLIAENKPQIMQIEPKTKTQASVFVEKNGLFAGVQNTQPSIRLKTSPSNQNIVPLTSKEALRNHKAYIALLAEETIEKTPKNKIKVLVSGHFIPAYSDGKYSSSAQNARGNIYSNQQLKGIMNMGGGLKIAINSGKRLSIQTGILYTRMGQEAIDHTSTPRTAAFAFATENQSIATPLGNIKSRNHTVAYRSPEATILNSMTGANENIEQVFGSLEIPLALRYQLNTAQRVLFSLVGGISGNFLVNNKVYLKSDNNKEWLGSTEDIRDFNISTHVGLGVEYPINSKIRIIVEPGFKYYVQSLSNNSMIDFKPYMFTLSTGLGIRF